MTSSNASQEISMVASKEPRKNKPFFVAAATLSGSVIEYYDFFLYATAAPIVFSKIMFPTNDPLVGTLLAFATFALGYLIRPIGGMVFGILGDKLGRKSVLMATILLMGISTICIGLVPPYAVVGIWAPLMLIFFRMLQGFGAGAEFGGAAILSIESAAPNRRGLQGAWPACGVFIGIAAASGIFALFSSTLSSDEFLSWGWRIPFLLSAVAVVIALVIRLKIVESPVFAQAKAENKVSKAPIRDVLKHEKKALFILIGAQVAQNVNSYVYLVFATAYIAGTLKMSSSIGPLGVALGCLATAATTPLFGALSDRIGRKPVLLFGAISGALFAFPFFWLINTRTDQLVVLGLIIGLSVGNAALIAPQGAYFSELFSARARFSGFSMGRELGSSIGGGPFPVIAVALVAWAGSYWPVALIAIGVCSIGLVAVALGPETRFREIDSTATLSADAPAEASTR